MCRRTLEHVNNHLSLRFYLLENSQFPSLLVLDFDFDLVLPFTFTFPFTFLKKSLSGSSCNNMKAFLAYATRPSRVSLPALLCTCCSSTSLLYRSFTDLFKSCLSNSGYVIREGSLSLYTTILDALSSSGNENFVKPYSVSAGSSIVMS